MPSAGKTSCRYYKKTIELDNVVLITLTKPHLSIAQISSYGCYLSLLCLLLLKNLFSANGSIILLSFQTLPLLIVLPGIYRNHYRAFNWLCFIVLIYFTAYVAEVGSPLREWTDYLGLTLSVLLFVSAMFTSRQLQRRIS